MKSKAIKISPEEKKMQARWDLDTLRQAKEIMKDGGRFKAAQSYAKEQIMALGGIVNVGKKTTPPTRKKK